MHRRCLSSLLTILLAIGSSGLLFGQRADRALVTGVITDPQGQSVAGAIVKVRNDDTGVVTDLTTNEAGSYSSPSLVLGTYTITVEMTGFKSATRPSIRLIGGQTFRQDIALELGEVSEQITVSASAVLAG